jgi:hypothetical protein
LDRLPDTVNRDAHPRQFEGITSIRAAGFQKIPGGNRIPDFPIEEQLLQDSRVFMQDLLSITGYLGTDNPMF